MEIFFTNFFKTCYLKFLSKLVQQPLLSQQKPPTKMMRGSLNRLSTYDFSHNNSSLTILLKNSRLTSLPHQIMIHPIIEKISIFVRQYCQIYIQFKLPTSNGQDIVQSQNVVPQSLSTDNYLQY